ncbi:MAG TPA: UbiA-like polyprenyltransferase [Elusimicrobiota bacterium]|nr:UbiA-like polyprenyltransferase [Elusimicrobiota bacterium]
MARLTTPSDYSLWLKRLSVYARFVKIEHSLFSLPLLFAGAVMASDGWPTLRVSGLVILAGIGARIFALTLNRLIDKPLDRKNPRTANREFINGSLSVWDVLLIGVAGMLVYLWSARALSEFCLIWSWVPLVFFAIYPYFKRFTSLSHVVLGITWAMAPLGGWFAVRPGFDGSWPAVLLAVFSVFWVAGFDIIYSTLDEDFDRAEGLFSFPVKFGRAKSLRISGVFHGIGFVILVLLYVSSLQGTGSAFCLLLTGFLLFVEHLIAHKVEWSFFRINVIVGFTVLLMVVLGTGYRF